MNVQKITFLSTFKHGSPDILDVFTSDIQEFDSSFSKPPH